MNTLFEPIILPNGTVIKNRFFKSAMNEAMGTRNLQPKKEVVNLYRQWAQGGAGLVVTGNVMVDPTSLAEPGNVVFNEQSDMTTLKEWAQAGRTNGTAIMVQINHSGKQAPKTVNKQPVAPSVVPIEGSMANLFNAPRALSREEIKDLVQKFTTAAKVAKDAGFSGVQIHAAHGYLINQFLSPHDNRRTDEYGGNRDNRMRFLVEIYQGMRTACGADFPIGMKINSADFREGGFSEEDSLYVIQEMENLGLDFIEISGGNYEKPTMSASTSKGKNKVFFADYSKRLKNLVKIPVIVTGGIRSVESMVEVLETNTADFIGLARPMAIDPAIPNKIAEGSYETIETHHLSTGIKALDRKVASLLGIVYYQLLMHQYAKGKTPQVTRNAWPSLLHALYTQGLAGLFPQRAK
ncbi:NADH:flavin oxidoreductase/NADH oxidase family protein [Streptococcus caprae]|uniref:NADH:flavin oxidoreductase/NADH oxidase family protein n=1 Tax=Streptococcus caprae TaxID=1640501 RepID=A0ABV8CWA1_9STRE